MRWLRTLSVVALATCATARPVAEARLDPTSGNAVEGTARFAPGMFKRITLTLDVDHLPPGRHAVHIHLGRDCSASGAPRREPRYVGDIDNLIADAHGHARLHIATREWSVGTGQPNDLLGKAVVIHEAAEVPSERPSHRLACGVIEAPMSAGSADHR
jgi:Cu-Zn family superoxide dismutase